MDNSGFWLISSLPQWGGRERGSGGFGASTVFLQHIPTCPPCRRGMDVCLCWRDHHPRYCNAEFVPWVSGSQTQEQNITEGLGKQPGSPPWNPELHLGGHLCPQPRELLSRQLLQLQADVRTCCSGTGPADEGLWDGGGGGVGSLCGAWQLFQTGSQNCSGTVWGGSELEFPGPSHLEVQGANAEIQLSWGTSSTVSFPGDSGS